MWLQCNKMSQSGQNDKRNGILWQETVFMFVNTKFALISKCDKFRISNRREKDGKYFCVVEMYIFAELVSVYFPLLCNYWPFI